MITAPLSSGAPDAAPRPRPGADTVQGPALSEEAFACIARLAHREAGLAIAPAKAAMVRTRLARRLRATRLSTYDDYCSLVQSPSGETELAAMISTLTTNVSHFFREDHHFATLRETVLPQLKERTSKGGRVRIWSAGCSNGQEPFSIAITLLEAGFSNKDDVKILATDIDPNVIANGKTGTYPQRMTSGLPPDLRDKYFDPLPAKPDPTWRASQGLRELITFRELNLVRPWPMTGLFDVVFCRNVVIYFDAETQDRLWQSFARIMPADSWLFLGHSERVSAGNLQHFDNRGITTYQRSSAQAGGG